MTSNPSQSASPRETLKQTVVHFIGRIARRREVCRQVHLLTRRQQVEIDAGNYPAIYDILHAKQHLLDQLQGEVSDVGLQEQYHGFRDRLDEKTSATIHQLLDDLEAAIQEVIHDEESCRQLLEQKREATTRELASLTNGQKTHQGYRNALSTPPRRRLDIKT